MRAFQMLARSCERFTLHNWPESELASLPTGPPRRLFRTSSDLSRASFVSTRSRAAHVLLPRYAQLLVRSANVTEIVWKMHHLRNCTDLGTVSHASLHHPAIQYAGSARQRHSPTSRWYTASMANDLDLYLCAASLEIA